MLTAVLIAVALPGSLPIRRTAALRTLWLSRRYSLICWVNLYQPNPWGCPRAGRRRRLGCSADTQETYHSPQMTATLTEAAGDRLAWRLELARK